MPFPTTAVLDNFNVGASQILINPPRTSWASAEPFTAGDFSTNVTPTNASSTVPAANMWNATFADPECFVTLSAFPPTTAIFEVLARIQNPGATPSMYSVVMARTISTDLEIMKRVSSTTRTLIGATITQAFTAGDSVGISVVGSVITSWYKVGAGAWIAKDSVNDSSITGAGRVGIARSGSGTVTIDDFGGGLSTASAGDPTIPNRTAIPFTQGAGGGSLGGGSPH